MKKYIYISIGLLVLVIVLSIILLSNNIEDEDEDTGDENLKPVIYLYPEKESDIIVKINYKGNLTCTYPKYNDSWKVHAEPNGKLINYEDGKEYSYLYWEGMCDLDCRLNKGFVVEGYKTAEFLQEKLSYMGLKPKEYNEFIVFWLPKMEQNKYNLIYFAKEEYGEIASLTINPKPDSIQRIHMVFKALNEYKCIDQQILEPFERHGFTVIEWGGTEID
ncbi:hypothetical protein [Vallitalea longa]|uniref:hypothetical protein n=1 Tax=Vallitalea longa TaxID=2936439 RepID=UPI0024907F18|nr:hypothetical protein [Vallitalea longa]